MRKIENWFLITFLLFSATALFAQGKITGFVKEGNTPLPGANITIEGTTVSTSSSFDGSFTLTTSQSSGNILISYLGYKSKTVPFTVSNGVANVGTILIESEDRVLEQVVVIGYGTRKKIDNTTATTSLNSEEITKTKVINASQAIQGKAAGVQVIASDSPGSTPTVVIRGLGTAIAGRSPLFIVDGMPTENINNINSNDITSYEILKDASALAIYGNRAANGVIMITTKRGSGNKVNVEYDSYVGFREPLSTVKMAGSNKYSHYSNVAIGSTVFSQDQAINTDWFKEITRTGNYSQHNLSISGASESTKYFFSLGYYDEKAVLDGLGYSRLTFRSNNDFTILKKMKLSQNFSLGYTHSTPKPLSAFTTAYKQSPIVPVYFPNGQYGVSFVGDNGFASPTGSSFNNVGNPVAQLNFFDEQQKSILMQGGLKLDFDVFKDLKFTSQFNSEYYTWKNYNFEDTKAIWLAADPTRVEASYPSTSNQNLLTKGNENYFNWNLSNYITYSKNFNDKHDIEIMLGIEASSIGSKEKMTISRKNVPSNSNYWSLSNVDYSTNVTRLTNEVSNENRLNSYFGRFQYKLMDKYLFTGTIRRDGSSQFAKDYRWGTFPSFGLGWILSKESFLKDIKGIDLLKLRGGWGKLGNQRVPLNSQAFTSGFDSTLGGSILYNGVSINSQIDPSLTWEITEETSLGLDFEFLNKKLKGSFDLYDKKTVDLILYTKPYITSGVGDSSPAHVGEVSNKGYEISLQWNDKISEKLNYFIGGNFSTNKNRLISLKDNTLAAIRGGSLGNGQYTKLLDNSSIGQPLGSFYLYEYAGINSSTGEMLYYKADGTTTTQGALVDADRKYVGSVLPNSIYGISLGINYGNFDLSVYTYGTIGSKVYNGKKAQRFSGENIEETLATDFWTVNNTLTTNPTPFNQVPVASTYYLESGDFFRVNNITFGYKIPVKDTFLSSARVYVNAINPFITKEFSGFSPELNGNGNPYESQGIELDAYPTLRSLVFGINLKF